MTKQEYVTSLRRIADAIEDSRLPIPATRQGRDMPQMGEAEAVGAAGILCYLRGLFTATDRETFSRDEILVILREISEDDEIFPHGVGRLMWEVE